MVADRRRLELLGVFAGLLVLCTDVEKMGAGTPAQQWSDLSLVPDGAEMAGLEHRAKVSDVGTGAVVSLKSSSYGGKPVGGGVVDTNAGEGSVG